MVPGRNTPSPDTLLNTVPVPSGEPRTCHSVGLSRCSHRLLCREPWSATTRLPTAHRFPGLLPSFVRAESRLVTVKVGPWGRNPLHSLIHCEGRGSHGLELPLVHPQEPRLQLPMVHAHSRRTGPPLATLHPVTASAALALQVLRTPSSPRSIAFCPSCHRLQVHPPPDRGGVAVILPDNSPSSFALASCQVRLPVVGAPTGRIRSLLLADGPQPWQFSGLQPHTGRERQLPTPGSAVFQQG